MVEVNLTDAQQHEGTYLILNEATGRQTIVNTAEELQACIDEKDRGFQKYPTKGSTAKGNLQFADEVKVYKQ